MTEKSQKNGDGKPSTYGLSPVAKVLMGKTRTHLNLESYGDHAELLGVGGPTLPCIKNMEVNND